MTNEPLWCPYKPCKKRTPFTGRTFAYRNHCNRYHAKQHRAATDRRLAHLEREKQRVAYIEARANAIGGIQAVSRARAKEQVEGHDIDDIMNDLQFEQNAVGIIPLEETADQWTTIRDIESDDYQSEEEDAENTCSEANTRAYQQPSVSDPIMEDHDPVHKYKVSRRVPHPTAGAVKGTIPEDQQRFDTSGNDEMRSPWYPFKSAFDFKMARWLMRYGATSEMITDGYNSGLLSTGDEKRSTSFKSAFTLRSKVDAMEPDLDDDSWIEGKAKFFADKKNEIQPFYYRRIHTVIQHFFKQPAFKNYLIYKPERHYNADGDRVYSDMYTGDWWNEEQEKIPAGSTLVPILFASDGTQLSTHAGDHELWPIYMSIGNIPSSLRSKPSTNSWILVAVLPIPPKKDDHLEKDARTGLPRKATGEEQKKYQQFKDDVLHQVLDLIVADLNQLREEGLALECGDGNIRDGRPLLGGWIADYLEYNKLLQIRKDGCAVCEISKSQLGDGIRANDRNESEAMDNVYALRGVERELLEAQRLWDQAKVRRGTGSLKNRTLRKHQLEEAKQRKKALDTYFSDRQLKPLANTLWTLDSVDSRSVWKPDILHTLYQGMVKHVLVWLKLFLQHHGRYGAFETAWLRIPPFQDIPAPRKAIGKNKQMTGKLLRNAVKFLVPTLHIALKDPPKDKADVFLRAQTCVRYIVDFTLVAQFKFHTEATIELLNKYLSGFHEYKEVFHAFRTAATAKKAAKTEAEEVEKRLKEEYDMLKKGNALRTQVKSLVNADQVRDWIEEGLVDSGFTSEEREGFDTVEKFINAMTKLAENNVLDAHASFTFIKIHLLSHFAEFIPRFGSLDQYSTEIGEILHKSPKEAYRKSNKHNFIPQILRWCTRKHNIRMRELNLMQLAKDGFWRSEIQGVLHLYADRGARRLAAKISREGRPESLEQHLKSLKVTDAWDDEFCNGKKPTLQVKPGELPEETDLEEEERTTSESEVSDETSLSPEEQRIRMPPITPLFSKDIEDGEAIHPLFTPSSRGTKTTRFLGGAVDERKTHTLGELEDLYGANGLVEAVKRHLEHDDSEYKKAKMKLEELDDLRIQIRTFLKIRCETVQAVEPLETLKAICSGPRRINGSIRNDNVIYIEEDSDLDEDPTTSPRPENPVSRKQSSRFGENRLGQLKCLFKLRVPKPECWIDHRIARGNVLNDESYQVYRLAYVQAYNLIRVNDEGEMVAGPEVARVKLATGRQHRGLIVMDLKSILRPAHLIPEHEDDEKDDKKMSWVVNNRIDQGTWDIIYGVE